MAGKGRDFAKPWRGSMEAPEQGELRGDGRAGGARGSWSVAAEPLLWEVSQSFRRLGAWPILLPAPPEVEPSVVSPAMSRLRPRTSGRAPRAVSRRGGGVRTPREVGEAAATAVVTGGCPAASRHLWLGRRALKRRGRSLRGGRDGGWDSGESRWLFCKIVGPSTDLSRSSHNPTTKFFAGDVA